MIEVKSDYYLNKSITVEKIKAAKEFCLEKNLAFSVWNEAKIFA
jgi:hypothetical protein